MRPIRAGAVATSVAAALVLLPGTAAADVRVAASRAEAGARDVTITFRVTNNDPAVPTRTGRPAETESVRSHRIRSKSSPARGYQGARSRLLVLTAQTLTHPLDDLGGRETRSRRRVHLLAP